MRGRRRIGSMSGSGTLAPMAWMTGARRTACGLGLMLLLAGDAVLASGQTMRRAALASGSASVVLIARVESLSVVANAETAAGPMVAASQPVSITTSWAVPANFTTFRVTRYFGRAEAFTRDGVGSLVVESGETNQARTRTDLLGGAGGGEKKSAEGGLLNILVQAL